MLLYPEAISPAESPTPPYEKHGTSLLVEQVVQEVLTGELHNPRQHFKQLQVDLEIYLARKFERDPVTANYLVAQRMRQAGLACIGALIFEKAMPAMTSWHQQQGSLLIPDDWRFNPYIHADHPDSYQNSEKLQRYFPLFYHVERSGYWIQQAADEIFAEANWNNLELWELYDVAEDAHLTYLSAWTKWKQGAGKGMWPLTNTEYFPEWVHSSLGLNLRTAIDSIVAHNAWYTLHRNPNPTPEELDASVEEHLVQMSHTASIHRHIDRDKNGNFAIPATQVIGAWFRMAQWLQGDRTTNLIAQFSKEFYTVSDATGCPHASLQNGPWANAGSCAGNIWFRYASDTAKAFFTEMDFNPDTGEYYNLALVMLAMGRIIARTAIHPVWPEVAAAARATAT